MRTRKANLTCAFVRLLTRFDLCLCALTYVHIFVHGVRSEVYADVPGQRVLISAGILRLAVYTSGSILCFECAPACRDLHLALCVDGLVS